jgi:hypothetical protein
MKIVERMYRRLSGLRKDLHNNPFDWNAPLGHVHHRLDSLRTCSEESLMSLCSEQKP